MKPHDILDVEKKLFEKQERLDLEREKLEKEKHDYHQKLERISELTQQEAKKQLLEEIEYEERASVAKLIKEREEEIKIQADKKAQEILVDAMRHGALDYIAEYTVSVIKVAEEELKGRIIGKEGRNIRA